MLVLIRVDGAPYRPVKDLPTSKVAIVEAVRSGGAFVPFLSPNGLTEIFITDSCRIRIDLVDDEPLGPSWPEEEPGMSDVDDL